jgi:hypothetical protein
MLHGPSGWFIGIARGPVRTYLGRVTDQRLEASPGAGAAKGAAVPDDRPVVLDAAEVLHKIRLVERGPFIVAQCAGCGWETFARRSRPLARREGCDHEILHAPPR